MKQENIIKLAIATNLKQFSEENFKKYTGVTFYDFLRLKKNKVEFLKEWRLYIKSNKQKVKEESTKRDAITGKWCNCDRFKNDLSEEIIWSCSAHGNCWNGVKNIKNFIS